MPLPLSTVRSINISIPRHNPHSRSSSSSSSSEHFSPYPPFRPGPHQRPLPFTPALPFAFRSLFFFHFVSPFFFATRPSPSNFGCFKHQLRFSVLGVPTTVWRRSRSAQSSVVFSKSRQIGKRILKFLEYRAHGPLPPKLRAADSDLP